jgi:hypothetical protein
MPTERHSLSILHMLPGCRLVPVATPLSICRIVGMPKVCQQRTTDGITCSKDLLGKGYMLGMRLATSMMLRT